MNTYITITRDRKGSNMKKVLFFDIDGTLINHDGMVCESTREALDKLKENGHLRFICTGRTKCMLPKAITEIDFDGFVYGAGTHLEYKNETVFYTEIPEEQVKKALRILDEFEIAYALEGADNVYVPRAMYEDDRPYFKGFIRKLQGVIKIMDETDEIHISKITCIMPPLTEAQFASFVEQFNGYYNIIIHENGDEKVLTNGLVELVPMQYNKATGIQDILQAMNMEWEQAIAVGDSNNDLEMLAYVPTSVCMGNGSAKAKSKASIVTDTIDNDGIAKAMKELHLI